MSDTLYTYRCSSCQTIAVAAYKSRPEKCVRCNLCRTPMRLLWGYPVSTDEERALFARGLVYNPGQERDKELA